MQEKEFLFTNLAELAVEKDRIGKEITDTAWQAVEYETEKYNGVMLVAPQGSSPGDITIPLGLTGWYKIYLGLITIKDPMYTHVKLDSDLAYSGIKPKAEKHLWVPYEMAHEVYWKSAKLSGDSFHMRHPNSFNNEMSAVMWIRCVEMTQEEIEELTNRKNNKPEFGIHAHVDTDFFSHDGITSPDEALAILQWLENTDVTMCSQEVALDFSGFADAEHTEKYRGLAIADYHRNKDFYNFQKIRNEAYATMTDYCRKIGIRLHAAMRMQMGGFDYPITYPIFRIKFAEEHPQFHIKTREGRTVGIMSYAYPEVQNFAINRILDAYKVGFDGVTLMWNRGTSLGFEKPVLKRISEKYDGLDGRLLPVSDKRLQAVWCEIMNEFMRKLRAALDEASKALGKPRCNINSMGLYTFEHNKQVGLDLEQWAKEGLVDGFTVSMYAHNEEVDDCMMDDGSGLIDMTKYCEKIKKEYIIKRLFVMDTDLMCEAIHEHEKLADEYGLESYYSLNWEFQHPSVYAEEAEKFYSCGAKGIHTWDTNGRTHYPPEWHVTSGLGHRENCKTAAEKYESMRNIYRVLRLGTNDISYVCCNWRG